MTRRRAEAVLDLKVGPGATGSRPNRAACRVIGDDTQATQAAGLKCPRLPLGRRPRQGRALPWPSTAPDEHGAMERRDRSPTRSLGHRQGAGTRRRAPLKWTGGGGAGRRLLAGPGGPSPFAGVAERGRASQARPSQPSAAKKAKRGRASQARPSQPSAAKPAKRGQAGQAQQPQSRSSSAHAIRRREGRR